MQMRQSQNNFVNNVNHMHRSLRTDANGCKEGHMLGDANNSQGVAPKHSQISDANQDADHSAKPANQSANTREWSQSAQGAHLS